MPFQLIAFDMQCQTRLNAISLCPTHCWAWSDMQAPAQLQGTCIVLEATVACAHLNAVKEAQSVLMPVTHLNNSRCL